MARHEGQITVTFDRPVPAAQAAELERRILFVSPEIRSFELIVDGDRVAGVRLVTAGPTDSGALAAKLDSLIDQELAALPSQPTRVLWRSSAATEAHDVFAELISAGLASECGPGQVALAGPLLSLLEGLDRRISALVGEAFGATAWRYPALIPASVLDATGYPAAFPQALMFVTRLHADLEVYREFQDSYRDVGGLRAELLRYCRDVEFCLPPTMCFHTFAQYRDRRLADGLLHTVTSRGRSFRHESGYARTLERLWDFTIREVVFLGTRQQVLDARERLMELIFQFVDELGLAGWCEVANDPFFIGSDATTRAWSQRQLELKYELRLPWAARRDLAVGSFNFHDDFFGRSFHITGEDAAPISSACAGFGLERLSYAVVCQHGYQPERWPPAVRQLLAAGGGSR